VSGTLDIEMIKKLKRIVCFLLPHVYHVVGFRDYGNNYYDSTLECLRCGKRTTFRVKVRNYKTEYELIKREDEHG